MYQKVLLTFSLVLATLLSTGIASEPPAGFTSIDTGYTICKVRSAVDRGEPYIVASSYEGTLLGVSYDGRIRWKNELSGFMNRDVWCEDVTADGVDEVLAANADGTLYCLDGAGRLLWKFKANDAPMNAVCVIRYNGAPYVVCGGYDTNLYYLTTAGQPVRTVASATYSREKPWGRPGEKRFPDKRAHIANFIRTVRGREGRELLAVHGIMNSNATTGSIYLFEPMANQPCQIIGDLPGSKPYGDLSVCDMNADAVDELVLGTSAMIQDSHVVWLDLKDGKQHELNLVDLRRRIDDFGYRVAQTVCLGNDSLLIAIGSHLIVTPYDFDMDRMEFHTRGYSFNDLWRDPLTGRVILGSVQSGGSCVHVIEPSNPQWKECFARFQPAGKLKAILDNTVAAREQVHHFRAPSHQRARSNVYMMTESLTGDLEKQTHSLEAKYGSPVFLNGHHMPTAEDWDRSNVGSEEYRNRRDRRRKYTLTQQQLLDQILPLYNGDRRGAAFWGGHGNDPYMLSTDTMLKIADAAAAKDKMSVFIYPELEQYDDDFGIVLREHFYPMAQHFQGKNQFIYVRTKHAFWQSIVYMPLWSRLVSGEFADVFVPSMEETTDKTMEQSLASRVGLWASGAVDQWGSRCARDNASFDRLRQHSHQMVPNHFLRTQVYNIAYGATFQNNFPVNQEYFSLLYELIAKGVLYVPKREEIVSFNPVHLGMTQPDERYLDEGNNAKWLTLYDEQFERDNPMVFSRLNGTWPGAPVTDWDFSRYAAGVQERRLNFLPPYPYGLVLITPAQEGTFADKEAQRGKLVDHLHPLYRDILMEHVTDGRNYLSRNGQETYAADEYYKRVEADIQAGAKRLPLTVNGGVAWVAAAPDHRHIRLTLVDAGYINPDNRTAVVTFGSVTPLEIVDILTNERIAVEDRTTARVPVPCGLFRFLDVAIQETL